MRRWKRKGPGESARSSGSLSFQRETAMKSVREDACDRSEDLMSMPIACPQCKMHGLVHLTRLQNAIKCPQCACEFIVVKGGDIKQVRELPHVRYACPRCHKSGLIPAPLAGRGAKCPGCRLPLVRGPDQRLHGAEEAKKRWKAYAEAEGRPSFSERISKTLTHPDGSLRKENMALMCAPLAALVGAALYVLLAVFDHSVETKSQKFTLACLSGIDERIRTYIEDDAVQDVELKRWRTRHFTSIADRHRPTGDKVAVEVKSIENRSSRRVLLVTMKSEFIGTRRHVQYWREVDAAWRFDALATLAEEDGPMKARANKPVRNVPALR